MEARSPLMLDVSSPHIKKKMQTTVFLDIETSLIDARTFRIGQQAISYPHTLTTTRLLTAAWGTMWDLYKKKENGVVGVGNHQSEEFKKNPLDDTYVLKSLWRLLDKAEVAVAHNANFDKGWIYSRFLQLGWPLPSKTSWICTVRALSSYNFTSKKLDALSSLLLGSNKIETQLSLWQRCSNGETKAFEEMLRYNKGDIYSTLFGVYVNTCAYYPDLAVDMADYSLEIPQCKVCGEILEETKLYVDRRNGLEYQVYTSPLGIQYRDRYNINSAKAGKGLVRHHV